jgi:hypothetical protein
LTFTELVDLLLKILAILIQSLVVRKPKKVADNTSN